MEEAQINDLYHLITPILILASWVKITFAIRFLYILYILYDFDLCSGQAYFSLFFHIIILSHLKPIICRTMGGAK